MLKVYCIRKYVFPLFSLKPLRHSGSRSLKKALEAVQTNAIKRAQIAQLSHRSERLAVYFSNYLIMRPPPYNYCRCYPEFTVPIPFV